MVVCLQFEKPQDLQALADIFYRATPQIMLRGDRYLFLEVSKCLRLYSVSSFVNRTLVTLRKLNLRAKIGVGEDVPTALSFALLEKNDKMELPIEALKYYFDPLGEQADLTQPVHKMTETLRALGIRTLKDFLKISAREISSRFSTIGLLAYYRVLGRSPVAWRLFKPSDVVKERHEFDLESPVDNLETIFFPMKVMIEKSVLRLRGKGKRMRQFDIILKQEHALTPAEQEYKISMTLQLPYVSNKIIFQVAREKIEAQVQAHPLKARIAEFTLHVTEEVPYRENQKNLFDQKKEENDESFFRFVSRMATKLGGSAVFFPKMKESYLPEKNWQRSDEPVITDFKDQLPLRPLRVLPEPVPVHVWGKYICWDGEVVEEIAEMENREVVFSEWWENSLERVYYRLTTTQGRQLWLFRTAGGDFLHGKFD